MTPEDFQRQLKNKQLAPAYLFLGPETWQRERCRRLLVECALPAEDRESGFVRYDLDETDLYSVMDDARSMSLFAANRLIWPVRLKEYCPEVAPPHRTMKLTRRQSRMRLPSSHI